MVDYLFWMTNLVVEAAPSSLTTENVVTQGELTSVYPGPDWEVFHHPSHRVENIKFHFDFMMENDQDYQLELFVKVPSYINMCV